MDMIVPGEQGCPEAAGKALGRSEQASANLGLPSVDGDASQTEQRADHDRPEMECVGALQTFQIQGSRPRQISSQVPDRGQAGLHVTQSPLAARRPKERYRLLVLRCRPCNLPLGKG